MSRELASTILICALEGLLSVMNTLMCLQITLLCEALVTAREVTLEGLLSDVSPFVDLQAARSRVALATDVTGKRFVTRMNQLMGFQVSLSDETLIAALEGADEGSFTSLYKSSKGELGHF